MIAANPVNILGAAGAALGIVSVLAAAIGYAMVAMRKSQRDELRTENGELRSIIERLRSEQLECREKIGKLQASYDTLYAARSGVKEIEELTRTFTRSMLEMRQQQLDDITHREEAARGLVAQAAVSAKETATLALEATRELAAKQVDEHDRLIHTVQNLLLEMRPKP